MDQIQAIAMAERALAKAPPNRVFAVPFTNRRDYDRADDAFTDMGCLTGEYVRVAEPLPLNPGCRSIERLRAEHGEDLELYVLQVAVPSRLAGLPANQMADCS